MIVMLIWLTVQAVSLLRSSYSRSASRRALARMQERHLRDIGLPVSNAQSRHLHFANAEAQLGMIR